MDSLQRKGIHFDLDTEALKKYYQKGDWHNAYSEIRTFFEKNEFKHIQGSGYHSIEPMSEAKAMVIIYRMTKEFPWLNYCVSICTIADVPEIFDLSYVFEKEAQWLDKNNTKKIA